jgi:hypothetical protein
LDHQTFDRLTRLFATSESRRTALQVLLGSLLGGAVFGESEDASTHASSREGKQGGDKKKGRRRGAGNATGNDPYHDDLRDERRRAKRGTGDDRGGATHEDALAAEAKRGNRSRGKGKRKGKKKGRKTCARAGQAPKRDHPCCRGLSRDGRGLCNELPPPPDGCVGDGCADPEPNPCTPDCDNKACGPDGCDGFCPPGCPSTAPTCNTEGQCVGCVEGDDCPDPGPCKIKRCLSGTCSPLFEQDGTNPGNKCTGNKICCSGACKDCCNNGHCPAPQGGTATCSNGFCNKFCTNNLHRLCGPNQDSCQECCTTEQCSTIDAGSICVGGTCQCPGSLTRCGMECIDTSREPNHCGNCTNVCASGMCDSGSCVDAQRTCGDEICIEGSPGRPPTCTITRCLANQECVDGQCFCAPGRVDCEETGICESCGRCGVTSCPVDPATGLAGRCCPGGFCSCGGSCEASCKDCWLTPTGQDREGTPTGYQEQCGSPGGCVDCWGRCCTACINGGCASSGPIGGGSIRRR